jgi:hypothetical protein
MNSTASIQILPETRKSVDDLGTSKREKIMPERPIRYYLSLKCKFRTELTSKPDAFGLRNFA